MADLFQTGSISYTGGVLELTNSNILNNFDLQGDFLSDSPLQLFEGSMVLEGENYTTTMLLPNYTEKINQLNQNLFEIKLILLIILSIFLVQFTYNLTISFIGKKL